MQKNEDPEHYRFLVTCRNAGWPLAVVEATCGLQALSRFKRVMHSINAGSSLRAQGFIVSLMEKDDPAPDVPHFDMDHFVLLNEADRLRKTSLPN